MMKEQKNMTNSELKKNKSNSLVFSLLALSLLSGIFIFNSCKKELTVAETFSELQSVVSGLQFGEGPAWFNGNLFFSDITANRIMQWNDLTGLTVFKENSGGANGLYFDAKGTLYVCEGGNKRIVAIDSNKNATVLTSSFAGNPYNEPNDLWVSPSGNIYFTDPAFTGTLTQDGQHVYFINGITGVVTRVANDLVKPNGIIGNTSGSILYIADYGASKIYRYAIGADGFLLNKTLFAAVQADGLSIDDEGNLYAASSKVLQYNTNGVLTGQLDVPGTITNLCLVKTYSKKLYITTHSGLYVKEFINSL